MHNHITSISTFKKKQSPIIKLKDLLISLEQAILA